MVSFPQDNQYCTIKYLKCPILFAYFCIFLYLQRKNWLKTSYIQMVAPAGIEPATQGFSVLCSTDWAMEPKKMAVPTRIELAIFCVTGRRDNRYTTGPFGCGDWIWTSDLWVMSPTSYRAALLRDIIHKQLMAEKEGFEPPRRRRPPGFQDRSLQPDLGISPKIRWCLRPDLNRHGIWLPQDFKSCASTNFATQA